MFGALEPDFEACMCKLPAVPGVGGGCWGGEPGPRSCGVSLGDCEGGIEEMPTGSCGVKTGMLGDSSDTSTTGVLGADTLSNGSSVVLCNDNFSGNSAPALPAERGWNPSLPGADSLMLSRSSLQKELLSIMKQLRATILRLQLISKA